MKWLLYAGLVLLCAVLAIAVSVMGVWAINAQALSKSLSGAFAGGAVAFAAGLLLLRGYIHAPSTVTATLATLYGDLILRGVGLFAYILIVGRQEGGVARSAVYTMAAVLILALLIQVLWMSKLGRKTQENVGV